MSPQRILLVSPVFHGYAGAIGRAFESLGHEVRVHLYDASRGISGKVANKLLHDLPERWRPQFAQQSMAQHAVQALRETSPDVVVTVKGDQLDDSWWEAVEESGAARVTWLYDEMRRTRFAPDRLRSIGPVASYSALDAEQLAAWNVPTAYVPLAFDDTAPISRRAERAVVFVGARYPSREQLLSVLHRSGVPVIAYGRTWSRHGWDVLRTRQWARPPFATGRDLDRAAAYGAMAAAPATLNTHFDQDGFTMRTFEACGVGGLQLVDRADVGELYEVGTEVLAFENEQELVELSRRAMRDRQWAGTIREAGRRRTAAEHTFRHRAVRLEALWD